MTNITELNAMGVVAVHVMGSDVETEEREPEHVVCVYFGAPLTAKPAGDRPLSPVLNLDKDRKEALISYVGVGQIFVCHSESQAEQVIEGAFTGTPVTTPCTIRWHGSPPIWIVGQAASVGAAIGGAITERRGA